MKSLSISLLLLLLLVHLAPADVAAQETSTQVIAPLGDLLIFQSPTGGLWRTDGTAAGTFQLASTCKTYADCRPIVGSTSRWIFFLVEVPELSTAEPRHQLWSTNGTREETRQLTRFPEGLPLFWPSPSYDETQFEGRFLVPPGHESIFFRGATPETGGELWVSNGTPRGTRLVIDLEPGPLGGVGQLLGTSPGRVLFEGITQRQGAELWKSDGTVAGTRLLRNLMPGPHGSQPRSLASLGAQLFFTFKTPELAHELWVSNGTGLGTSFLHALWQQFPKYRVVPWIGGIAVEEQVFLQGYDRQDPDAFTTSYVFRSDGTPEGTYSLQKGHIFGAVGNSALLVCWDSAHGREPWISDGTPEGTHLLSDLEPGAGSSGIEGGFGSAGSFLYFLNRVNPSTVHGWLTDGTPEGTSYFFTFGGDPLYPPASGQGPDDRLFFTSRNGRWPVSNELWVTPAVGGTPGSVTRLLGPSPSLSLPSVDDKLVGAALGDSFLFVARDPEHGTALWRSDATRGGTYPIVQLAPPPGPDSLPGPIPRLIATLEGENSDDVRLEWDWPSRSDFFELEWSFPATEGFVPLGGVWGSNSSTVWGLIPNTPYTFRVRAWNVFGAGPWTETSITPLPVLLIPCVPSEESLCLHGSRFEVKVAYRDHIHGTWDVGHAAPLDFSDDSGAFWFFDHDNLELMVKVLDARVVNGYFWSFFGGLTSLETWITVTDTEAQTNVTFHKGPDNLCGRADVKAFPRPAFEALVTHGTCEPGPDHLCLTGNRYRVEVAWRDQRSGHTGVGHAIPGTEDSGFFWFFDDENVELLVKVLDATTVNGHVWVFSGSMTDVEYTLTVTDTLTGEHKQYFHPPGSLCGQADVAAF